MWGKAKEKEHGKLLVISLLHGLGGQDKEN
jgi:hypothetical protein